MSAEPGSCSSCGTPAALSARFCGSCGAPLSAASSAPGDQGGEGGASIPAPSWRDVARAAQAAAAPYAQRAAEQAQRFHENRKGGDSTRTPLSDSDASSADPESAGGQLASDIEPKQARPPMSERVGRAVGGTAGHATRALVGTAAEPVVDKVWKERPDLPTWQKVLGAFGWGALVLTPQGWVILAVSFIVMVLLGRYNPYTWAAWITRWSGFLLLLTLVIAFVLLAAFAINESAYGAVGASLTPATSY